MQKNAKKKEEEFGFINRLPTSKRVHKCINPINLQFCQ